MTNLLQRVFEDKLVGDRVAAWTMTWSKTQIDAFPPSGQWYIQFFTLMGLNSIVAFFVGELSHHFLVEKPYRNSSTSFLVAFGVLIPFCFWFPYCVMDYLDIRNKGVRFALITGFVTPCKVLATVVGYTPDYATQSKRDFMFHFACSTDVQYDKKTQSLVKSSVASPKFWMNVRNAALTTALMTGLFSWMDPLDYLPFETPVEAQKLTIFMDINHLLNNYAGAVLLCLFLTLSSQLQMIQYTLLIGYEPVPITDNPLLLSTSPRDFWGRRWNNVIHLLLKRCIYKPVRRITHSAALAALVAFLGSGFYHEWFNSVIYYVNRHESCQGYCTPVFGKQIAFFGWNALIVILEYVVAETGFAKEPRQWMNCHVPRVVIATLVICTALPVAHWFTSDLAILDFFQHVSFAFPKIVFTARAIEASSS